MLLNCGNSIINRGISSCIDELHLYRDQYLSHRESSKTPQERLNKSELTTGRRFASKSFSMTLRVNEYLYLLVLVSL